jgi:hypothetical protein
MSDVKDTINKLMSWGIQISKLYDQIEKIIEFTFHSVDSVGYYRAKTIISGREYVIERKVAYKKNDLITLPPEFAPGMIKEILTKWAVDNNINLSPTAKLPDSIYLEKKDKELRCMWPEV